MKVLHCANYFGLIKSACVNVKFMRLLQMSEQVSAADKRGNGVQVVRDFVYECEICDEQVINVPRCRRQNERLRPFISFVAYSLLKVFYLIRATGLPKF
jgi:hypothetical protein